MKAVRPDRSHSSDFTSFKAHRFGLTLMELLIVIGIIAVLAGIIGIAFSSVRAKAREVVCRSNLRVLHYGLQMYREDWDGIDPEEGRRLHCYEIGLFPLCNTLTILNYGVARANLICPSSAFTLKVPPGVDIISTYDRGWWGSGPGITEYERKFFPPFPSVVAKRGMRLPVWLCGSHREERGEYPIFRVLLIRLDGSLEMVFAAVGMDDWEYIEHL